ncbi:MAG TPA: hypothetical protein VMW08_07040 [Acidimicrobiales bacterium]|nr:hypothetical protein [Acidimicrobiales bacterium]
MNAMIWGYACHHSPSEMAMYERRVPRVRLDDGTLGIPEDALKTFELPAT